MPHDVREGVADFFQRYSEKTEIGAGPEGYGRVIERLARTPEEL
jgi:hypothetical protein